MVRLNEVVNVRTDFFGVKNMTVEVIKILGKTSSFIAKIISPAYLRGGQIVKKAGDVISQK